MLPPDWRWRNSRIAEEIEGIRMIMFNNSPSNAETSPESTFGDDAVRRINACKDVLMHLRTANRDDCHQDLILWLQAELIEIRMQLLERIQPDSTIERIHDVAQSLQRDFNRLNKASPDPSGISFHERLESFTDSTLWLMKEKVSTWRVRKADRKRLEVTKLSETMNASRSAEAQRLSVSRSQRQLLLRHKREKTLTELKEASEAVEFAKTDREGRKSFYRESGALDRNNERSLNYLEKRKVRPSGKTKYRRTKESRLDPITSEESSFKALLRRFTDYSSNRKIVDAI